MKNVEMLLNWETHDSRFLYAYEDRAATAPRFNLLRSESPLVPEEYRWYIERNHFGLMVYTAGVRFRDPERKAAGIEALDYGVARQNADGSFTCNDAHHSAAFFLEALARFIIVAGHAEEGIDLARYRDTLAKGADWFRRRSSWDDDWWRDTFHHRFFLNPAGLFLTWEIVDGLHGSILEQAYAWMAEGIRRQDDDGAITEFGGHDTGYQSLSITFATGVLMLCELHPDFAIKLERCVRRAADWLAGRVGDDGRIDGSGNSRMSPESGERTRETGEPKDVKYYETAFALYGAGLLLDDARYLGAVDRIMSA